MFSMTRNETMSQLTEWEIQSSIIIIIYFILFFKIFLDPQMYRSRGLKAKLKVNEKLKWSLLVAIIII